MASESSDPITAALIETEKEVAGFAWDNEETEAADPTGDQSLEDLGDGLEGQHEAEDDDADEGDEESEAEGEQEGEGKTDKDAATGKDGKGQTAEPPKTGKGDTEARIPPGRLREANEARRAAEAERDTLKAQIEKTGGDNQSLTAKLDLVMREIAALKQAPRSEPRTQPPKPETVPDIFEDPKGFAEHLTKGFQAELAKRDKQVADQRVENSFAIAHAFHKDTFATAFEAINKLDPRDPDARATVQRIYASPNPGEALVGWHKREQTRAEVGDDVVAYRERVAKETREALLKDPEFRKQLIADMRGEASTGDHGTTRTVTRLPRSLAAAPGSNVGAGRSDPADQDGSQQAIADAAWR